VRAHFGRVENISGDVCSSSLRVRPSKFWIWRLESADRERAHSLAVRAQHLSVSTRSAVRYIIHGSCTGSPHSTIRTIMESMSSCGRPIMMDVSRSHSKDYGSTATRSLLAFSISSGKIDHGALLLRSGTSSIPGHTPSSPMSNLKSLRLLARTRSRRDLQVFSERYR
jgi:hypothetical protein